MQIFKDRAVDALAILNQIEWDYDITDEKAEDILEYLHEKIDEGCTQFSVVYIAKLFGLAATGSDVDSYC